jgi:hypothetical protein
MRTSVCLFICVALTGCGLFSGGDLGERPNQNDVPSTIGEHYQEASYVPLDPIDVTIDMSNSDNECANRGGTQRSIPEALPDNTVRLATAEANKSGSFSFKPLSSSVQNRTYRVILDYVNSDTTYVTVRLLKQRISDTGQLMGEAISANEDFSDSNKSESVRYIAKRIDPGTKEGNIGPGKRVTFPVIVGVGSRLRATVNTYEAGIELTNIVGLAAAAESGRASGTLVVQTLGITGAPIVTAMPMPKQLNTSTVQDAILSMGSIKTFIYNKQELRSLTVRVTGFVDTFSGGEPRVVTAVMENLLTNPVTWRAPCNFEDIGNARAETARMAASKRSPSSDS